MGGVHTNATTVCSLQQLGSNVTVTCAGAIGNGPATGRINAKTIQPQVRAVPPTGFLAVLTFRGTLAGSQMRGTWTISAHPGASGTFNAVRS